MYFKFILNKYVYLKKKKRFCKNHTYFLLKNIIIFNLVLLHLSDHTLQCDSGTKLVKFMEK